MEIRNLEPNRESFSDCDGLGRGFRAGIQQNASTVMLASDQLRKHLEKLGVNTGEETLRMLFSALDQSALQLTRTAENVDDLLRSRQKELCPSSCLIEISAQLEKMVELCRKAPAAEQTELTFESALAEGEGVYGDPHLLGKILLNLLSNAMRAANRVEVRLEPREDEILLTVQDNGPGLSREIQEHLFEPFVTDHLPIPQIQSGLGLFLAREYSQIMGWTLELESGEEGTCARVVIPRKIPEQGALGSRLQNLGLEEELRHSVELEMSTLDI